MKIILGKFATLAVICSLVGCAMYNPSHFRFAKGSASANQNMPKEGVMEANEVEGTSVGGNIRSSMDKADIVRMSRALDKSPGKTTTWISVKNGTSYTVTPIKAVTVGKNHFCRLYSLTAEKGESKRQTSGTACVGADANWKDAG